MFVRVEDLRTGGEEGEEIGVGIVDTGWISFKGGYFDGI